MEILIIFTFSTGRSIVFLNILTPSTSYAAKRFLDVLRFGFVVFVGSHFEPV